MTPFPKRRMALLPAGQRGAAQGHALIKRAIVADFGGLADDDAHAVIDKQPPADVSAGMNFDPGKEPPEMRYEASGEQPAVPPQPMADAVKQQRVKPRVAQHDLEPRAGGGVASQGRVNFLAQVLPQHRYHYINVSVAERAEPHCTDGRQRAYNCPTKMIKNCGRIDKPSRCRPPTGTLGFDLEPSCLR